MNMFLAGLLDIIYERADYLIIGELVAILFPNTLGEYVAFCDGDDYWIDDDKLKIQVEELEKYPEIDMCFHSTYKLVEK